MAQSSNHYQTLNVSPTASQAEIKRAYRRLAKQFHPDTNPAAAGHEQITQLNAAYEILGDPSQRQSYDRRLLTGEGRSNARSERQERAAAAQQRYRRQTGRDSDEQLQRWISLIYQPVSRQVGKIINPLQDQIDELAADPFDDELLDEFQAYLDDCRTELQQAQRLFRSIPNPASVAGAAAHLYYALNQVGDGIDELERYVTCFDEHYLHTGQELFRIAYGLRREAQAAMRDLVS